MQVIRSIPVLIYSRSFAPALGGIETFVMQLARGLSELPNQPAQILMVTRTPAGGYPDASLPFRIVRQPSLFELLRLLQQAEVVHLAGPTLLPLLIARMLRKRVVIEHHGFQPVCPNGQMMYRPTELPCPGHFSAGRHLECWRCNAADGWLRSLWMWLLTFPRRRLCNRVHANIVPTSWLGTVLQLPRQVTIHHGVAASNCLPTPRIAPAVPTFAFVGRLVSTKGVPVLLEAAAELRKAGRDFRLLIIGDGPERPRLEGRVRELELESFVSFTGALSVEALEDALARVTGVVLPSLGGEVFGLAAAESLARGHAVVVSDLGSLAEVVGDSGLVFEAGNATELAHCMQRLAENSSLAAELGSLARERATRVFSEQRTVEQHVRIYYASIDSG